MKKTSKVMSIFLAVVIMLQASITAFATTKTGCLFNSSTYTHQTKYDGYTISQGIDLSHHNDDVDFVKVKKAGVEFVILRVGYRGYATKGKLCNDVKFETYIKEAKAAGLKVGVYYYSQAITKDEAIDEANYVLDKLGSQKLDLPIVWDIEYAESNGSFVGRLYNANLSKSALTTEAIAFCDTVKAAGYEGMVYASASFLEDHLNHTTIENAGYDVWLAHYTTKTTYAGEYRVWQFTSKGNIDGVSGEVDCNFMYTPPEDGFTVSEITNRQYTGSAIKPAFTVSYNGNELIKGEDYVVSFKNNVDIGTASITITGYADYADVPVTKVNFKIIPTKVTNLKLTARTDSSVSLSWDTNSTADGYLVKIYKNGAWSTAGTTSSTSLTVSGLSAATDYKFKVKAYKTVNSTKYYGYYNTQLDCETKPAKVSGIKLTVRNTNYIQLNWTKQANADSYKIYKYNSTKKEYVFVKEVTTNSVKLTGLSANTCYKYKIKAYKTAADGTTLTGSFSDVFTTYTRPVATNITSIKSSATKRITVKWDNVSGATGYQVMWSTTKDFSSNYKSVYVTKGSTVSKTITTAQSNKKYYVKVRAYKTRGDTKIYSYWCTASSVKTK